MSNILLTNICNRHCSYCFARKNMADAKGKELSFKNLKFILEFLRKSGEGMVRLMGGEPTLHSKFQQFVDYILSRGFKVHIFTNGLFSVEIADFLTSKGESIKYSFNIDPPERYLPRNWKLVLGNLKAVAPFGNCLIGRVIWQENFNIDYLLDLAVEYSIKIIMLRIANPIIGGNNKYVSPERYRYLAKKIMEEVKKAHRKKIKIGFGCGFAKKMFTEKQLKLLKDWGILNLKWGCDANSGRFDIDTDLSVFRCFPLATWKKKKLSDFKNVEGVENYFMKFIWEHQLRNADANFIRNGPCLVNLLKN